jgi:uroporphyrin-III C-methyltransferase
MSVPHLALPDFARGSVWLVGAGPGDPGLLTLLARHALERADVVLHDALVAREILALKGATTWLETVGKRAGAGGPKQLRINQRLIDLARQGLRVLRLKGGDPFVFGRGGEEALALAAAGVPFRVVPGVTSGIGGPAYAGIPATHRMRAQSVAFVTGHAVGSGDPPAVDWPALANGADTIVLYMGLGRLNAIAQALLGAGRAADEPVAILEEATTPRQRHHLTTLARAAEAARGARRSAPPTLIVIGSVVSLSEILSPWQQIEPAAIAGAGDELRTAQL